MNNNNKNNVKKRIIKNKRIDFTRNYLVASRAIGPAEHAYDSESLLHHGMLTLPIYKIYRYIT